jgi:DNA-binding transcriptional MerR regulator
MADELSLTRLCDEAERRLRAAGLLDAQADGRVTPAPDVRTVRYYTTLGLLDRPTYEGREARYSRRHVLQVAAVKALQARGMPLTDIQARLYGRSDRELDAIVEAARIEVRRRPTSMKSVHWREISIEPGLRIQAEAGWAPADPGALEQRIRAAIAAFTGER